ncbi:MAG: protoporphyrin IX magnesium chelatase, partial [Mycobacteriaceae bacterium]|nr:protoporphyrin IX magnesium chelatase [Mycobacteriaceae bacterium]
RIAAGRLAAEGIAAVVIDCETSIGLGLAAEVAGWLRAPVMRPDELRADYLATAVRAAA